MCGLWQANTVVQKLHLAIGRTAVVTNQSKLQLAWQHVQMTAQKQLAHPVIHLSSLGRVKLKTCKRPAWNTLSNDASWTPSRLAEQESCTRR